MRGDPCRGEQKGQQAHRQRERAEEVAAELQLEVVRRGHSGGRHHHSGVVQEQINGYAVAGEPVAEVAHRGEVGQIDPADLQVCVGVGGENLGLRLLALVQCAYCHDHMGAGGAEALRSLLAGAAVCAGDDDPAAGLIRYLVHDSLPIIDLVVCYDFDRNRPPVSIQGTDGL